MWVHTHTRLRDGCAHARTCQLPSSPPLRTSNSSARCVNCSPSASTSPLGSTLPPRACRLSRAQCSRRPLLASATAAAAARDPTSHTWPQWPVSSPLLLPPPLARFCEGATAPALACVPCLPEVLAPSPLGLVELVLPQLKALPAATAAPPRPSASLLLPPLALEGAPFAPEAGAAGVGRVQHAQAAVQGTPGTAPSAAWLQPAPASWACAAVDLPCARRVRRG